MSLKNYSTSICVDKTISEIEKILSTHGASDILKHYDGAGNVTDLNFIINTEFGNMPQLFFALLEIVFSQVRYRKEGFPHNSARIMLVGGNLCLIKRGLPDGLNHLLLVVLYDVLHICRLFFRNIYKFPYLV